ATTPGRVDAIFASRRLATVPVAVIVVTKSPRCAATTVTATGATCAGWLAGDETPSRARTARMPPARATMMAPTMSTRIRIMFLLTVIPLPEGVEYAPRPD